MALYLEVANGKVKGPELVPFQLPDRWTFDTLQLCIEDYVGRHIGEKVVIDNIYFKKSRSKTVVMMKGDGDISALLSEYPLTYKSG